LSQRTLSCCDPKPSSERVLDGDDESWEEERVNQRDNKNWEDETFARKQFGRHLVDEYCTLLIYCAGFCTCAVLERPTIEHVFTVWIFNPRIFHMLFLL
jgi:hypothetical protein